MEDLSSKLEESIQYAKAAEHLAREGKNELAEILKENLRYTKAIYADTQRIRRYMFWRMTMSFVWLVLVIAPIILALIYLPPFLSGFFQTYRDLLGDGEGLNILNQLR